MNRRNQWAKIPKNKKLKSKKTQMTSQAYLKKTWRRIWSQRQKARRDSRKSSICLRIFLIKINLRKFSLMKSHRNWVWAWTKVLPRTPLFRIWLKSHMGSMKTKKSSVERPPNILSYRSANPEQTVSKLLLPRDHLRHLPSHNPNAKRSRFSRFRILKVQPPLAMRTRSGKSLSKSGTNTTQMEAAHLTRKRLGDSCRTPWVILAQETASMKKHSSWSLTNSMLTNRAPLIKLRWFKWFLSFLGSEIVAES